MAKEKTEKVPNMSVCQFCKNHCNKPSFCKATKQYVARKQDACPKFKTVKEA